MLFKSLPATIMLGFILIMSGCATSPDVTSDFDTSYDFSSLKRYSWIKDENKTLTLDRKRQINAIETILNRKGFIKADNDSADFLLKAHVVIDKKVDVDQFYNTWGYYPHFYPSYPPYSGIHPHIYNWPHASTTRVREIKIGTLILDIVDPAKKEVIWRGTVAKPLGIYKDISPEERTTIALVNADAMLARFPPL